MERKIVTTYLEWLDVKAYGSYKGNEGNTEIWEYDGAEYELNILNLSLYEKKELLYALNITAV